LSQDTITLTLEKRDVVGKGLNKLRREGQVPAVIHNHGKESVVVSGPFIDVLKVYQLAGKHHPVTLKVDDKQYMALIKSVDFEPKKNKLRHVVFNAIKQDEKQKTEVPVKFVENAEIPAEKTGLMVIRQLETVEIEALPKDLIDELIVDPSGLTAIGDRITVADIKVPEGITILTEAEHPIATVEETKAQMSEEAAEEEAAEGEEGEEESGDSEAKKESSEEE
jgi:large subunit ribosomal protein L25